MAARKRKLREPTHDWQEIKQYTLWPEQEAYEKLRPVLLFGETAASRAQETGTPERTLLHQARLFEQEGMVSLFPKERASASETNRSLPQEMRQLMVDLKAEHPGFTPHEIATICFLRFERRPSDHTVKRVLAEGPPPSISGRRYPAYAEIADGDKRRRAIVDLHAEGWSITTIAAYLQTSRARVYEVLKRWAAEGHAGLEDRPTSAPQSPARKVTMDAITEVRKRVRESPELGAYRVRAALEQIGIHLSQATCGRLLALNRKLYGLSKPKAARSSRQEMPFKAHFKQEIWSVDIRYIEEHNLGFPEPVYLISVLENYSRACLASKISATQNQWDYLQVLFDALSAFGAPSVIVSDGGGQFYSNQAMDVYAALGIRKERIEQGQPWQNYIESHFNTVRKMADAKFARARSWEEMLTIHRKWMHDYNSQRHFAHEKREDGCHSPAVVLGEQKGTVYPESVLSRILFATRYVRRLDKHGFLRYQDWKFYGERGLPHGAKVTVWIYEGSLKVEHQAVTLSEYEVSLLDDHRRVQEVRSQLAHETPFRSPQLTLIDVGPDEWRLYWRAPEYKPRHRPRRLPGMVQLPLFEALPEARAVGQTTTTDASSARPHLSLIWPRHD